MTFATRSRRLSMMCAAALLALFAAGKPTPAAAGAIQTTTGTQSLVPGGQDIHNYVQNADAESYVERVVHDGTYTSSALAQVNGNLEVGVTLAPRTYFQSESDAFADLELTQHYEAGDARIGGIRFTVQPGEILFTTELHAPFAGEFDGQLIIGLTASINDVAVSEYSFLMGVKSTNGGIDINSGSNDIGLQHLSEVLSGGRWGVRTSGFTDVLVITPAIFPGDVVKVAYNMEAKVNIDPLDARYTFSAKIGDPLDAISGGTIEFVSSVPEPASEWLMAFGLFALGTRVPSRRWRHGPRA